MRILDKILEARLDELARSSRLRRMRPVEAISSGRVVLSGRPLIDFAGNDYLGLRDRSELIRRGRQWAERWGVGSSSSRLVTGDLSPLEAVETKLARGKRTEAALIFNSGFQANTALIPSLLELLGSSCQVFSDRLNHASIHLGCQAARVREVRYRHNDLDHLRSLLKIRSSPGRPSLILAETVFSMDGDRADVAGLVELAEEYDALLFLDEAHATGIFGPGGFGLSVGHHVDLVMGTFGKALGSFGAYVACSAKMREYLVNRCAGFIYSTALPPAVLGAVDAALDLLPALESERCKLLEMAGHLRQELVSKGFDVGTSASQIVPVMLRDEERVLEVAQRLEEQGILAAAIRPPSVPKGSSRLRLALSARHSEEDIAQLVRALQLAVS
jgi:8-amino-7-oxononanoate synthase